MTRVSDNAPFAAAVARAGALPMLALGVMEGPQCRALLAETRREAEQMRARADEQAKRILADAESRAKERQQQIEEQAEATTRQIEERVMAQVRVQLADMVVTAVERVTRGALDASAQRGLVQQFLSTNGAPGGGSTSRYEPNATR